MASGVQTEDSIRWERSGACQARPAPTLSSPLIFLIIVDEHMLMPDDRNHVLEKPHEAVAVCRTY
jgi:hypothetical protein